MNKIKVLYDVVKAMKNKEAFNGTLTVQVHQEDAPLFSLRNEFEKNLLTGQTKAKINTEFTMPRSGECRHHEFIKHLHHSHTAGCEGLKGKMAKLACALSILNALHTEEQEDKTIVISLNATDLPADTKAMLHEKMSCANACHHHGHGLLKEFCAAEDPDFVLNIFINKNYEVEKIVITLVGTQKDEQNAPHDLTARAELSFTW